MVINPKKPELLSNEVKNRDLILYLNHSRKRYAGSGMQKAVEKAPTFKETFEILRSLKRANFYIFR